MLVRFEHPASYVVLQSVHFDLNPYALQVPSGLRRRRCFSCWWEQTAGRIRRGYLALAHNHSLKATRALILQNQAQESG